MSDEEVYEAAEKYTVFGRVKPHQKQIIVKALKNNTHIFASEFIFIYFGNILVLIKYTAASRSRQARQNRKNTCGKVFLHRVYGSGFSVENVDNNTYYKQRQRDTDCCIRQRHSVHSEKISALIHTDYAHYS